MGIEFRFEICRVEEVLGVIFEVGWTTNLIKNRKPENVRIKIKSQVKGLHPRPRHLT